MNRFRSSLLALFLAAVLGAGVFMAVHPVLADTTSTALTTLQSFGTTAGFNTTQTLPVIIAELIRDVLAFLGVIIIVLVLYGGFMWMTAGGNEERVKKARRLLTNAVIGLVIVLSSFAITQFVLSALVGASGGGGTIPPVCTTPPCLPPYIPPNIPSDAFVLSSFNSACAEQIKNLELQLVFSKSVLSSSVTDGGVAVQTAAGVAVPGTFTVSGKTVTFVPDATCPEDAAFHCFDADTDYTLVLDPAVLKATPAIALTCSLDYPCSFAFHTGSAVDTAAPSSVAMDAPEDGAKVIVNDITTLFANTTDDVGVSILDFVVDGTTVFTDAADPLLPTQAFQTDLTEWNSAGYLTNQSYDIWATGTDCAGNAATADHISVMVRAANCGNGVLDTDLGETGVDCGGVTSGEYYCGACDLDPCVTNADCSSGFCQDGLCVTVPEITSVTPDDGAEGNYVTIAGSGFGTAPGSVTFDGAGVPVVASVISCDGVTEWTDKQIIVEIPAGATDGPLEVQTTAGYVETTNNDFGPSIADFDVNAINRPGICSVLDPATLLPSTVGNSAVNISGIHFNAVQGTSTVYFRNYLADSYASWADGLVSAVVPLVNAGDYLTQVFTGDFQCVTPAGDSTGVICATDADCDAVAGETCATGQCSEAGTFCNVDADCADGQGTCASLRQGSNTVNLTVTSVTSDTPPVISYTDSGWASCDDGSHCTLGGACGDGSTCSAAGNWGPHGQYVTIFGSGFGTATGTVYFTNDIANSNNNGVSAIGVIDDFPLECGDDFWNDDQITVKVPTEYTNGTAIEPGAHTVHVVRVEDGLASNDIDFNIVDDVPGPGICLIDPVAGPVGTPVEIIGDNFGNDKGVVTFFDQIGAALTAWGNSDIFTSVPTAAKTGPVAAQDKLGYVSNALDFSVGDCTEDASVCDAFAGTECCSDGSCSVSCTVTAPPSHYAYLFSTGDIPAVPRVLVYCGDADGDGNPDGVSPSPWSAWSQPADVCVNAAVHAEFSEEMDTSTLNAGNITVEKCVATSGDPCLVRSPVDNLKVDVFTAGFSWYPAANFDPSTTYQVTLNGGDDAGSIQSADHAFMAEDYTWQFTTAATGDFCEIGAVYTSPATYTATAKNQLVGYLGEPVSAGDACVVLSCVGTTWDWNSSHDGATFENGSTDDSTSDICTNTVTAVTETDPGTPAVITATVSNATNNPSDSADLTIDFTDPEITGYQPNCDAACVNAALVLTFNTAMDPSTLSASAVSLFACGDATCEDDLVPVPLTDTNLAYSEANPASPTLTITPGANLAVSTNYLILVSEDATSTSGVPLSRAHSACTVGGDSCIFKTSSSSEPCAIDRVALSPSSAAMTYVGERQEFDAIAYGQPDDCSADGEVLNGSSYVWSNWKATDTPNNDLNARVAFMLPSPSNEGNIALTPALPVGCSSSCLNTGSAIQSSQAICGDGVIGDGVNSLGEDCDDGGTSDGDGCSSVCLREGANGNYGTCGNGIVEQGAEGQGEDCDGGVACSDLCLNRGTSALNSTFAVCGDGTVDYASTTGGEDCDDGNNQSFDGCSSNCLNEGSEPENNVFSVCGDGVVGPGEECDDGGIVDGDGCSAWCLHESGECVPGVEGCSPDGLWAGSSPTYATASFCGDGIVGSGEECDATDLSAAVVGPYGVSQISPDATQEVDATTGFAYSVVSAQAEGITGEANLSVQCSCETDAACGSVPTLGCGTSGCCFARPIDEAAVPVSGSEDVCRNAAVWVEFNQPMDPASFDTSVDANGDGVITTTEYDPQMYLALTESDGVPVGTTCPVEATNAGYVDTIALGNTPAHSPSGNVFARAWQWISGGVSRLFGRPADASAVGDHCVVPVTFEVEAEANNASKVRMHYDSLLLPNATYQLIMNGDGANPTDGIDAGVLSVYGVGINVVSKEKTSFSTGAEVCALSVADVQDLGRVESLTNPLEPASPGLFSQTDEQHRIQSAAFAVQNGEEQELEPTADYNWTWSGGSSILDGSDTDVVATTPVADDVTQLTATAAGQNGTETVIGEATIATDNVFSPTTVGEAVVGDVIERALLCENPWPSVDAYPYVENGLNYSFSYCRDAGESGTADDLPALHTVQVPHPLTGIYREFLYQIEGTGDAIGVRVVSNPDYLPPDLWYEQQGFTGSPVAREVDGYEAVQDGNTIYVETANQTGAIYPNIVVISWNENAGADSQNIVDQILTSWQFNANTNTVTDVNLCSVNGTYPTDATTGDFFSCTADADCATHGRNAVCDAQKAKLRRDTRRLSDIVRLHNDLTTYGENNQHCSITETISCGADTDCPGGETCEASVPTLAAGSYVRSTSLSAWPSWSSALGNAVGVALPDDPLNAFSVCPDGFASDTCFNETQSTFVCPVGSHIYGYRAIGTEAYELHAVLENDSAPWAFPIDQDSTDNATLSVEYARYSGPGPLHDGFLGTAALCNGTTRGESGFCGDGVVGADEDCEIGDSFTQDCTTADGQPGQQNYACTNDCQNDPTVAVLDDCIPFSCGNGVVELGEECDDGSANGSYGACGEDCTYSGTFSCGDGYLAGGEACDCGRTADFSAIMSDHQSWAALNGCVAANGQYTSGTGVSCAFDCSVPGPSCGDGEINGAEECDGGFASWAGAVCGDGVTSCTTDSDCTDGSSCGDGGAACGSSQVCVGGDDASEACTSDADCANGVCSAFTYDLTRTRTCNDPSRADACTWPGWSACLGGDQVCGNGLVEGTEACDDGNDSDNDSCLNTCELNVCGDDKVFTGVESCDDGSKNGAACDPLYDSNCNFCSLTCQYKTTSGSYCGDGVRDEGEACDGADIAYYCFDGATRTKYGECDPSLPGVCPVGQACRNIGVCNGGDSNGLNCTSPDAIGLDTADCGTGGSCQMPVCAADCGSTCPTTYNTVALSVLSEEAGAVEGESVELNSYLSGETPDNASIFIPECNVATKLTADVSLDNVVPPTVAVVFAIDMSNSMGWSVDGSNYYEVAPNRRIDAAAEGASAGIGELFQNYAGLNGIMKIGLMRFSGPNDSSLIPVDPNTLKPTAPGWYTDYVDAGPDGLDLLESSDETELQSTLDAYLSNVCDPEAGDANGDGLVDGCLLQWTPTYLGVQHAVDMLDATDADVKIVILLSDGNLTHDADWNHCTTAAVPPDRDITDCVQDVSNLVGSRNDIQFYSIAIGSETSTDVGYIAHMSSATCGTDWGNFSDCAPTSDGITYNYAAATSDDIVGVYQTIIDTILNTTFTLTTADASGGAVTTSGTVLEGTDVVLPFPAGFACTGSSFTIPFNVSFNGTGTLGISNLKMTYCPVQ